MAKTLGKKAETKGEGRSIVLYAPPFAGKTTYLADPEVKVLLADMDHNTSPLDDADNVTIFPIDSFEDYLEFKTSVQRGYFQIDGEKIPCKDYDVIALDSFTRFEELIKKYVATKYAPNRKREIEGKFGAQTDWDDLQSREVAEVREWQAMTRSQGFNVLWIGHDMAINDSLTGQVARIQLALQGKYASARIMSAVDAVMYLHKYEDKDKTIKRVIYTQNFGAVQADARLPVEKRAKLPSALPLEKMPLSKVLPYLGYKKAEVTA
jgi:hypothetical protein